MKRNHFRNIIGGLSFTSALFIFQACYGTPQDLIPDVRIHGKVLSKTSGLPIPGIRISVADQMQHYFSGDEGGFSFYSVLSEIMTLRFEDVDSTENGYFADREAVLRDFDNDVYLEMELEEK